MSNYKKDSNGQWWYYEKNGIRRRASLHTCDECGKVFPRKNNQKRKDLGIFCSKSCTGKYTDRLQITTTAKGEKSPHWKGGIRKRRQYVSIYSPNHPNASDGYVLEHRLVMENYLGRYLNSKERVHHIDGDPLNNDISNLKLMNSSEHASLHNKTKYRDEKGRFIKST